MRALLWVVVCAVWAQGAIAKTGVWSDELIGDVPLEPINSNTYIDTVVGTCKIPKYPVGLISVDVPGMEDFKFRNERFKYNHFRTDVFLQREEDGGLRAAPLMVIFPGIFGASFDNATAFLGERYWRKGYHVLVIPNPWSRQYTNQTVQKMGEIVKEAENALSLIYQFQDYLRELGALVRTQHMGLSYGAFLGAVANALDSERENRIDGQVVLLGPPAEIVKSFKRLDEMVDDSQLLNRQLSIFAQKRYFDYFCKKYPDDYDPGSEEGEKLRAVARMFVAIRGFHSRLASQISSYDLYNKVGHRPTKERDGEDWYAKLDQWQDSLRFQTWFDLYAPEILRDYSEEERSFGYWYGRASAQDRDRILVLSASNDFLNRDGDWTKAGDELLLLPTGGHLGYRTDEKVLSMIDRAFEFDLK